MLKSRSVSTSLGILIIGAFLASGCAPATYNRYQTAHPLGTGEMKLAVAANLAHDPIFLTYLEMEQDMNDEMYDWARENDLDYDIEDIFEDVLEDILVEGLLYGMTLGASPDLELMFAIGVHDRVDVEARVTASQYYRLNSKILLLEFGKRGAMSISPGLGYRSISNGEQSDTSIGDGTATDRIRGNLFTIELPLIVGWKFAHVAPYLAPIYVYHYADVNYTRTTEDLEPNFDKTLQYGFSFHNLGLTAGVQFTIWHFVITPEIVGMYHAGAGVDYGMIYPGLSIGGTW